MSDLITKGEPIPKSWKEAKIVLIHKGGTNMDPANYRLISLLQTMYKTYTSIITRRLAKAADKYILCQTQKRAFLHLGPPRLS